MIHITPADKLNRPQYFSISNVAMQSQAGISYIEILIATLLISICIIPAMESLRTGMNSANAAQQLAQERYLLRAKMATVLAAPYVALAEEAAASSGPADLSVVFSDLANVTPRMLVYISGYDIDNADADNNAYTGIDDNIFWVSVKNANSHAVLETLVAL